MVNGWLILWSPRTGWGRLRRARVSCLRGRRGSGVKGTPKVCRAQARCEAPLRLEGRPRILRGLHKISGGVAASACFALPRGLGGESRGLPGLGEFVVDGAEHAARGMSALAVVVVDPVGYPGPGGRLGAEGFQGA